MPDHSLRSYHHADLRWTQPAQAGNDQFQMRAAAIIINGDSVLLVEQRKHGFFYTVGGTIRHGETSTETVIREVEEETGLRIVPERLLYLYEVLYHDPILETDSCCHEINFFYLVELSETQCESLESRLMADASQLDLSPQEALTWVPYRELAKHTVYPTFLAQRLNRPLPCTVEHIIDTHGV